jgi:hypothetical protein
MMGKINNKSGVEIIPLNEVNYRNNRTSVGANSVDQRLKMDRLPYMSDPTIVPRVQKVMLFAVVIVWSTHLQQSSVLRLHCSCQNCHLSRNLSNQDKTVK